VKSIEELERTIREGGQISKAESLRLIEAVKHAAELMRSDGYMNEAGDFTADDLIEMTLEAPNEAGSEKA